MKPGEILVLAAVAYLGLWIWLVPRLLDLLDRAEGALERWARPPAARKIAPECRSGLVVEHIAFDGELLEFPICADWTVDEVVDLIAAIERLSTAGIGGVL